MNLNDLAPYIPVLLQLIILAGALYTVRAGRPKVRAEARQAEARATVDLVTGFGALLAARQKEIDDLHTKLDNADQKALFAVSLARQVEQLEADLRKANQHIAVLKAADDEPERHI